MGVNNKNPGHGALAVDTVVLLAILAYIASFFNPADMFSSTITAGGDTASHYNTVKYLKEYLLPQGKIMGWEPGNYAGFPLFQFYFPLPFLVMVLLSFVIPLQVAFKIISIIGVFLLPLCAYGGLRMMRYSGSVPVFAALATLPFLFMDANSMWGGNIASTLAGEFSYSIGFSLSVLFMGALYQGVSDNKWLFRNTLLLVMVGMSHGYALLFAGLVSSFFLITTQDFLRKLWYLIRVYALAFLLMGLWLIPLLVNLKNDTSYNLLWVINDIKEVFPEIFWPFIALAFAGRVLALLVTVWQLPALLRFSPTAWRRLTEQLDPRIWYLWFTVLLSAVFYTVAYKLHVVDIRFLPYLQLYLCIIAAVELAWWARALRPQWVFPVLGTLASLLWLGQFTSVVKPWAAWNYSGFETKPMWPVLSGISEHLKGSYADPRVVYEHYSKNADLGTVRTFESIPLFSGRATLEGLYMQSSLSSPFVFYLQSEISAESSCPFPQYGCTNLDLAKAVKHLQMFNVRDFIVRSDAVKAALKERPEFVLKKTFGPYAVYELTVNDGHYVTPLPYEPSLVQSKNWKMLSYQWFRSPSKLDVPLVYMERPDQEDLKRFKTVIRDDRLPNLPKVPTGASCTVKDRVENEEIHIDTNCIGKPLLVKVSWHPNWRVDGARKIYQISPAFMLIYPEKRIVRMYFARTSVEYTGLAFSGIGLFLLAIGYPGIRGSRLRLGLDQLLVAMTQWVAQQVERWSVLRVAYRTVDQHRLATVSAALTLVVALFLLLQFGVKSDDPGDKLNQGMRLYLMNKYPEARQVFAEILDKAPYSGAARTAYYHYAIAYYKEDNCEKTLEAFQRLIREDADSNWVPEAYYHLGLCNFRLGENEKARAAYQHVLDTYSSSGWAEHSRARLTEMRDIPIGQAADSVATYNKAMRHFDAGRLDEARDLFSVVMSDTKDKNLAQKAAYFYAITYFKQKRYEDAIDAFVALIDEYPKGVDTAEAYYHIGLSNQALGEKSDARESYKRVLKDYASTRWAPLAKMHLQEL